MCAASALPIDPILKTGALPVWWKIRPDRRGSLIAVEDLVDVAAKAATHRIGIASGRIQMEPATLALITSAWPTRHRAARRDASSGCSP